VAPARPEEVAVAEGPQVLAHKGASYLVSEVDGLVRLVDGTLTVRAPVRLVVGGSEIDSRDGTFDVVARADRLVAVRVLVGGVELHGVADTLIVRAGESWHALAAATDVDAGVLVPDAAPRPLHVEKRQPPEPELEMPAVVEPSPDAGPAPVVTRGPASDAFDKGWNELRAGQFLAAARAFEQANRLADDPRTREDASYWRAVALARASQIALALTAFETFLTEHPASVRQGEASVGLGWLLLERGDLDGARARFQAARRDGSARVRASAEAGLQALAR